MNFQTLTPEHKRNLIKQLEQVARDQPQQYRLQVGMLAILGYLYILLIFGLLGIGLWILRALCIAFDQTDLLSTLYLVVAVVGLIIIRMFWLTIPKPKGIEVTPETTPQLFDLTHELTRALATPPIHHILISPQMNAGILQRPRLGVLGWFENYLVLGLPLLKVLSPDQVKAVIAHELGHLSGNHSRFRNWIYRIRRTWLELMGRIEQQDAMGWFFKHFFQWYGPFFDAYSFVLARANEYEADQIAAQQTHPEIAAEALIRVDLYGYHWIRQDRDKLQALAATSAQPPAHLITDRLQNLTEVSRSEAQQWYARFLSEKTDTEDTHPSLADRLTALGYPLDPQQLPTQVQDSAAHDFLAEHLDPIARSLDQLWQEEYAKFWESFHTQVKNQMATLQELESLAAHRSLSSEEAWKRAQLTQWLEGSQAAYPLFEQITKQDPDHPKTLYSLGLIRLQRAESERIKHLKKAMDLDPALVIPVCEHLSQHYRSKGDQTTAEYFEQRLRDHEPLWEKASRERSRFSAKDSFSLPDLSAEQIQRVVQILSQFPDIREAVLVQKHLQHFPERPLYILGLNRRFIPGEGLDRKLDQQVIQELDLKICLPGDLQITILNQGNGSLFNRLKQIKGAQIY